MLLIGEPSISIYGPSIPWRTVSHNQMVDCDEPFGWEPWEPAKLSSPGELVGFLVIYEPSCNWGARLVVRGCSKWCMSLT